jgi:hypothetical protein
LPIQPGNLSPTGYRLLSRLDQNLGEQKFKFNDCANTCYTLANDKCHGLTSAGYVAYSPTA